MQFKTTFEAICAISCVLCYSKMVAFHILIMIAGFIAPDYCGSCSLIYLPLTLLPQEILPVWVAQCRLSRKLLITQIWMNSKACMLPSCGVPGARVDTSVSFLDAVLNLATAFILTTASHACTFPTWVLLSLQMDNSSLLTSLDFCFSLTVV